MPIYEPSGVVHVDYPKDLEDAGETDLDLQTGEISVHLNPKLKKNPALHDVVLQHEIEEGLCGFDCHSQCHEIAVSHEPPGSRAAVRKLLDAHMNAAGQTEPFNALDYQRESLAEELYDIQRHATDGSALKAGCACIQEKHLLGVHGLAGEAMTIATDEKEKAFYQNLVDWAAKTRKYILANVHEWKDNEAAAYYTGLGDAARELRVTIQQDEFKYPSNPADRAFLPHGLTETEKTDSALQRKLSRCIKETEIRCCGEATSDYSKCSCNPVAVCRASLH